MLFIFHKSKLIHLENIITFECGYHIGSTAVLKLDRHLNFCSESRESGRSESFSESSSRLSDSH